MGKLYIVTVYTPCPSLDEHPKIKWEGWLYRYHALPYWTFLGGSSVSYRVWNYVWGEDPDD